MLSEKVSIMLLRIISTTWDTKDRQWQCAQFFIRAHFCKDTGERRAFFGKNTGNNTGKFDLVHVQSVIDLFAKQLNNALNLH